MPVSPSLLRPSLPLLHPAILHLASIPSAASESLGAMALSERSCLGYLGGAHRHTVVLVRVRRARKLCAAVLARARRNSPACCSARVRPHPAELTGASCSLAFVPALGGAGVAQGDALASSVAWCGGGVLVCSRVYVRWSSLAPAPCGLVEVIGNGSARPVRPCLVA